MSARRPDDPITVLHPSVRPPAVPRKRAAKPPTVQGILRQISRDGFRTTKDVETDRGVAEHVVCGPTGAFIVVAKSWRRHVWVASRPARVMVGRSDVTDTVRRIAQQALELERRARRAVAGIEVRALVVVTGTRLPGGPLALGRATILDIERFPSALTAGTTILDDTAARLVADAIVDPSNVVAVSFGAD